MHSFPRRDNTSLRKQPDIKPCKVQLRDESFIDGFLFGGGGAGPDSDPNTFLISAINSQYKTGDMDLAEVNGEQFSFAVVNLS